MKNLILLISIIVAFTACNKDSYIDTGLANGEFNGTIWEYLQKDTANWSLTALLIERAGLIGLFEGRDANHPKITFFGPTNLSIQKYLYEQLTEEGKPYPEITSSEKEMITFIPEETCKQIILSHVIDKEMKRDAFGFGLKDILEGGTQLPNLIGKTLRIFRLKETNGSVPDVWDTLWFHALESGVVSMIASSNIHTTNGYVHSLSYTYTLSILE